MTCNQPSYPVYCAWCPTDRRTIIGTVTVPGSHGICPMCAELLRQGPHFKLTGAPAVKVAP